jgi:hypothetical protein
MRVSHCRESINKAKAKQNKVQASTKHHKRCYLSHYAGINCDDLPMPDQSGVRSRFKMLGGIQVTKLRHQQPSRKLVPSSA